MQQLHNELHKVDLPHGSGKEAEYMPPTYLMGKLREQLDYLLCNLGIQLRYGLTQEDAPRV